MEDETLLPDDNVPRQERQVYITVANEDYLFKKICELLPGDADGAAAMEKVQDVLMHEVVVRIFMVGSS